MMGKTDFLYNGFLGRLPFEPTDCQSRMLSRLASFLCDEESDIMVINGYAGTGKTSAVSAAVSFLTGMGAGCVLLAPTGRAAKVMSGYASRPAWTIHKYIYRQKSVSGDGFGEFAIGPSKDKDTVYFVDEVSLIGMETVRQHCAFGSGNLLDDLVEYVRKGSGNKLVLVGDAAQLPPVGLDVSPVFDYDYMASFGSVSRADMTTVVRQRKESGILRNATVVREKIVASGDWHSGDFSDEDQSLGLLVSGFGDIERISGADLVEKLTEAYEKYGEDETIVLTRSNKRAVRYNAGIRSSVQFKEDRLVRDDKLMIVRNCYKFADDLEGMDYIANGDMVRLLRISRYEERYGLHFAEARLSFPDYGEQETVATVLLDTLDSESASLTYEQQNALYEGVLQDYSHISSSRKRMEAVREDRYYNALQLKYAYAITCHKSQGGQWKCVFIDNPFLNDGMLMPEELRWLYTAVTRGVEKVFLVNFKDSLFISQ